MARATAPILFGLRALTSTTHMRSSCCRLSTALYSRLRKRRSDRLTAPVAPGPTREPKVSAISVLPWCPVFIVVLALNLLAGMILFAVHLLVFLRVQVAAVA